MASPERSIRWTMAVSLGRLLIAWGSVTAFLLFDEGWVVDLESPIKSAVLFLGLLAVIVWCAFGVVDEADRLAELLGEPLGTLVLTLSIVIIEVALIAAVMVGAHTASTLGRDTMFAVLMIILNGVVGLALLLGGLRHGEQEYNLQGAVAYLAVIGPLSVVALVLPNFTRSTPDPTLSKVQAFFFGLFTMLLYGVFLAIQTVRHRSFFVEPGRAGTVLESGDHGREPNAPAAGEVRRHTLRLVVTMLPIVLLAKPLGMLIDYGIAGFGAPAALGGVLIALIVFTPEAMSGLRAALDNLLQRAVNLCLGLPHRPSASLFRPSWASG